MHTTQSLAGCHIFLCKGSAALTPLHQPVTSWFATDFAGITTLVGSLLLSAGSSLFCWTTAAIKSQKNVITFSPAFPAWTMVSQQKNASTFSGHGHFDPLGLVQRRILQVPVLPGEAHGKDGKYGPPLGGFPIPKNHRGRYPTRWSLIRPSPTSLIFKMSPSSPAQLMELGGASSVCCPKQIKLSK